jgi:DNA-directed RNA polymerase subunit RPC12/RpoP
MPYTDRVRNVMAGSDGEKCPHCGGQWFAKVCRLREGPFGYALDEASDDHRADEAFACATCGAVVTQDQDGGIGVEAPRVGRFALVMDKAE